MIAPVELHAALADALADLGAVADDVEAIDAPIAVLTGLDAKGLEFDHVIVVEPARLVAADRAGPAPALRGAHPRHPPLVVVHAEPLPGGARRSRPRSRWRA